MLHVTVRRILGKSLWDRIASRVAQADRSLCVDQDWWAHLLGWDVTRTGFGARSYRDPRFDTLLRTSGEVDGGVRA